MNTFPQAEFETGEPSELLDRPVFTSEDRSLIGVVTLLSVVRVLEIVLSSRGADGVALFLWVVESIASGLMFVIGLCLLTDRPGRPPAPAVFAVMALGLLVLSPIFQFILWISM